MSAKQWMTENQVSEKSYYYWQRKLSLGKFKEIEDDGKEVYINKDILSRISLGFTSAQPVGAMPNIIILPQATYHLVKDYKTVDKKKITEIDEEGNEEESIEYFINGSLFPFQFCFVLAFACN